jgi:hypothetical protein
LEQLSVEGIEISFNPVGGMLDRVTITREGRTIQPLHRAPWIGRQNEIPAGEAPHLGVLAGDFFCAPFGASDQEPAPAHGWPANGLWTRRERAVAEDGTITTRFDLDHKVLGAALVKELILRPGHPIIYQRHIFEGGEGAIPVAHHAMIRAPGGARLSFSNKDFGATPNGAPEPDPARGRSLLAYPQRFESLASVELADGRNVDARTYPFVSDHEDLVCLVDPLGARFGWTAALAKADGFLFFAVKDPRVLGQTVLWMSNGGRSYAPWSSRHRAVLGLEEGATYFAEGHRASTEPNDFTRQGYKTALTLAPHGETVVRYALGAIPADPSWTEVADITLGDGTLTIKDIDGDHKTIPYDSNFFSTQ